MRPAKWLFIILSLGAVFAGCDRGVPSHSRPQALASWFARQTPPPPTREPAQTTPPTAPVCWRNAATPERLRVEIARLEIEGPRIRARWPDSAGMDLAELPRSQAELLALHGGSFSPQLISYAGCGDIYCVFNRSLGQPDTNATGTYAYWLYLKTGAVVATEKAPFTVEGLQRWNSPENCGVELSARRFSPAEVRSLVDFVRAMPEGWVRGAAPQVLYRYRRGYRPVVSEATCAARNTADERARCSQCRARLSEAELACGVPTGQACATSTQAETALGTSGRYTVFTDSSLALEGEPFSFRQVGYRQTVPRTLPRALPGEAWFTLAHEFTHLIDSPDLDFYQLSGSTEWLDLVDSDWITQESDHVTRWVLSPREPATRTRPPSVTRYAASHPAEDLAETLAYTRLDAENSVHNVPQKADFVSRHLLGGRSYTPRGLAATYTHQIAETLGAQLPHWLDRCRAGTSRAAAGPPPAPELSSGLLARFPAEFRTCVSREFEGAYQQAVRELQVREMEACDWLPSNQTGLRSNVIAELRPSLEELLGREDTGREISQAETALLQALADQIDPRETVQECWNTPSQPREECYTSLLGAAFDVVAAPFQARVGSRLTRLRTQYLHQHRYADSLEAARRGYLSMLNGVEDEVRRLTQIRWAACQTERVLNSTLPLAPAISPFSGGETYLDPRLLDCLNRGALEELHATRDSLTGATHALTAPAAVHFVDEAILIRAFREVLAAQVTEGRIRESTELGTLGTRVRLGLVARLSTRLEWITGAFSDHSARALCLDRTLGDPTWSSRELLTPLQSLRFTSADEWRGSLAAEVCAAALATPAVRARVEAGRTNFGVALRDLQRRLLDGARHLSEDCSRQVPSNSGSPAGVASARAACFENEWPRVTQTAFNEWDRQRTGGAVYYTAALEPSRRATWSHLAEGIRAQAVTRR